MLHSGTCSYIDAKPCVVCTKALLLKPHTCLLAMFKPSLTLFIFIFIHFFVLTAIPCAAQKGYKEADSTIWVDSVFATMNQSQKIAQLMMVRAYSNSNEKYYKSIDSIILKYKVGGLVFFQGGPVSQAKLTNRWQALSPVPLLIGMDAENGLGMRLDSTFSFPDNFALGALSNDTLIYQLGKRIGQQCKSLGVHINFAPVADVNSNPLNPVINSRSFGEDPSIVATKVRNFLQGIQSEGIIGCIKHFPGHGDTETDSHHSLPIIAKTYNELLSNELIPFTQNLDLAKSIMIGHLYVPAFDSTKDLPASLSKTIITGLLKDKLGYKGLIISDALDMKGVANSFNAGNLELQALAAGNDVLLLPTDIEKSIQAINQAIDSGLLDLQVLTQACKKVLSYKYQVFKNLNTKVALTNLVQDLSTHNDTLLFDQLIENSITLLKNEAEIIPLSAYKQHLTVLPFFETSSSFSDELKLHLPVTVLNPNDFIDSSTFENQISKIDPNSTVLIVLTLPSIYKWKEYGLKQDVIKTIDTIAQKFSSILVLKGNPYALNYFKSIGQFKSILVSYSNKAKNNTPILNTLLGSAPFKGKLPVSPNPDFRLGIGLAAKPLRVLQQVQPDVVGISPADLNQIDSIVNEGLAQHAYPGCQVLLAKDGKVFYNKCFGKKTYDDTTLIKPLHLYDVASVTKMAATTLAAMKLYEEGRLHTECRIENYLPYMKQKGKHQITVMDLMAHQAGFEAWIPFYTKTLTSTKIRQTYYKENYSTDFGIKLTDKLFLRTDYSDSILLQIARCQLPNKGRYVYSDLGFILLKEAIEKISKCALNQYTDSMFFKPMGMVSTSFLPLNKFTTDWIVPTEYDTILRQKLLCGEVNDKVAALFGGVSGHAGLFSNAFDMAKFMQMLLWNGEYAGRQYLKPATIMYFTSRVNERTGNRRGLGFDKPPLEFIPNGPVCKSASARSFGHSGFTGTYVWADPDNGLVFVFLSNRVYPRGDNTQLSKLNIRTRIHEKAYELVKRATIPKL